MSATETLARRYAIAHTRATADCLNDLPPEVGAAFLADLESEVAAELLAEMWPTAAAAVIEHAPPTLAGELLEMLTLSKAVTLLRLLRADHRDHLLTALPATHAERVRHALSLPHGTAGSAADTTVAPFDVDATVAEARARGSDPRLPYLYVVDREYRLAGVIHRRELDAADAPASLAAIMTTRVVTLAASAPLALVHDHGAWSELDALPVVDGRGALVGVIRHKTLRASPRRARTDAGPAAAVTALLDLGEVYWSSLFSAIQTLSSSGSDSGEGDLR